MNEWTTEVIQKCPEVMYSLLCRRHIHLKDILRRSGQLVRCVDTTERTANVCESDLRERIYSYLYISPRFANIVYNVLQPKYDLNFLHKTMDSIQDIQRIHALRSLSLDSDLNQMAVQLKQLIELKTTLEPKVDIKYKLMNKIQSKKRKNQEISEELNQEYRQISDEIRELNERVYDLEEVVIKFVLNIPNDIRDDVPQEIDVISHFEPKDKCRQLYKHLNYIQLSYINKCLFKSIVGPKSCYLMGISAQLNHSLVEFFGQNLRQKNFVDISGIDFVKTAVIESTNYHDLYDYKSDKLQVKAKHNQSLNDEVNQSLHFVGNSSFESICAVISKRIFNWTSGDIKLLSIGQQFEQNLSQNNSLNAVVITKDDMHLSNNQMNSLYELLWKCFTQLDLKCRAIRSSVHQLERSQFSGIDIEVWLQSQNQWITASQITHYKDYVSIRLGAPDSHLINASIHLLPIITAIIEQNQTIEADIEIPDCLKQYFL